MYANEIDFILKKHLENRKKKYLIALKLLLRDFEKINFIKFYFEFI